MKRVLWILIALNAAACTAQAELTALRRDNACLSEQMRLPRDILAAQAECSGPRCAPAHSVAVAIENALRSNAGTETCVRGQAQGAQGN